MSSFWETYPCTRHPIEFKPLDDLVNDKRYRLYSYPSLEYPRQLKLDINNPDEFDSIPRDFCLLSSPGKVSWQTRDAQNHPKLEIFHTDIIRIPTSNLKQKFPDLDYTGVSYLTRWYYHGLTLANVTNLLKDKFNLSIPLSSDFPSDHWIPSIQLYNVEVERDVWQNRLAVFFDGNIGTSNRSMRWRINEHGQLLKADNLGVIYLATWRTRWRSLEGDIRQVTKKQSVNVKMNETLDSPKERIGHEAKPPIVKTRGRKRRSAQRQLRFGTFVTVSRQHLCPEIPSLARLMCKNRASSYKKSSLRSERPYYHQKLLSEEGSNGENADKIVVKNRSYQLETHSLHRPLRLYLHLEKMRASSTMTKPGDSVMERLAQSIKTIKFLYCSLWYSTRQNQNTHNNMSKRILRLLEKTSCLRRVDFLS